MGTRCGLFRASGILISLVRRFAREVGLRKTALGHSLVERVHDAGRQLRGSACAPRSIRCSVRLVRRSILPAVVARKPRSWWCGTGLRFHLGKSGHAKHHGHFRGGSDRDGRLGGGEEEAQLTRFDGIRSRREARKFELARLIAPAYPDFVRLRICDLDCRARNDCAFGGLYDSGDGSG